MSAVGAGQQHSTSTTDRRAAHLRGAPAFQVICGCLPRPTAADSHHVRRVPPETGFGQTGTAMLQTATRTAHGSSTKHRFASEQVRTCSHKPPCQALDHGGSTHAGSHWHPLLGQLVRLFAQALIVLVGNRRHACTTGVGVRPMRGRNVLQFGARLLQAPASAMACQPHHGQQGTIPVRNNRRDGDQQAQQAQQAQRAPGA